MNNKLIAIISSIMLAGVSTATYYYTHPAKKESKPFTTLMPTQNTIRHTIHTTGMVKIKDSIRVGSLVSGLVKEILVEENDIVTSGQLLATLDNGKSDTAIRAAKGHLIQAHAAFNYQKTVRMREQELFAQHLRSAQDIELVTQQYRHSKGALISAKAAYDSAIIERTNTQIKAPDDGIIIAIGVKKGVRVTTDLDATILFEIAKDISKMEAELLLEESAAGHVKRGQKVTFTVDNHPHKKFKTTIKSVSYSPIKTNAGLMYRALVDIDNKAQLLRPGMTLHATIKISKQKQALSVENIAFYLDPALITTVGNALGYTVRAIPPAEKKKLEEAGLTIKYLWTHQDNLFIEQAIETGIYDDRFIEAKKGIEPTHQYLSDITQPNEMDALYKKMFKGAL